MTKIGYCDLPRVVTISDKDCTKCQVPLAEQSAVTFCEETLLASRIKDQIVYMVTHVNLDYIFVE